MPNEPRWLTPAEVVEINRLAVAATAEPFGVRDAGLLASACERPRHHWQYDSVEDVHVLAAKLLFGIARNHPFLQGNKRTGFVAARAWLLMNGWDLDGRSDEILADIIISAIEEPQLEADATELLGAFLVEVTG